MSWLGRFIWHDLMTTDREAAAGFYTGLLGWKIDHINMGSFTVSLINVGGRRVGGIMQEEHIPHSHWMPYIAVDDADAICGRIRAAGGAVCIEPGDVPPLGRFAVVNDPQGGFFSVLKRPADRMPPPEDPNASPPDGSFVWDELTTTDPDGAAAFYASMFGWNIEKMDMGPESYWLVREGRRDFAGMLRQPPGDRRPAWTPYISVPDVDASVARAGSLGAKTCVEPRDIPQVGRFAVLADPTGAVVTLYRDARAAAT
jgi:predicted enzyme related to lactoylglutathione lyase